MDPDVIKGHLVLVMAPMASGKGVLIRDVLRSFPESVAVLTTCTTRERREGETDGVDYYFISRAEFERKRASGEFIEWAEFSGNLYGTPKTELIKKLSEPKVIINEIDLQGIEQLLKLLPRKKCTIIYIDAGDWETLKTRALSRSPISEEHLALRERRYHEEVAYKENADVVIHNYDGGLDTAKEHMRSVVRDIIEKLKEAHV